MTLLASQFAIFVMSAISGSMEPTMMPGDLYTVNTTVPFDSLQEGDIICFYPVNPEMTESDALVHRIVDLERGEDGLITEITTQGDNEETNPEPKEGVDITDDVDREQLLELYIGKVSLGSYFKQMGEEEV